MNSKLLVISKSFYKFINSKNQVTRFSSFTSYNNTESSKTPEICILFADFSIVVIVTIGLMVIRIRTD